MTKRDISSQISEETGVTQIVVQKVVQKTLDYIVDSLSEGETIELRNFGVFKIKSRKGRLGRNPRTGDEVPIPPKKVVVFKPGKVMKEKLG